ncbi:MAG: DUF262 domain-containing protein [Campylobacterota bacterium]|nr:DUF262 domain-containing protein [Campylobacterota bacterium]
MNNNEVTEYEEDKILDESVIADTTITNPFSTKDIKISNAIVLLPSLVKRLEYGEIINPDFQRNANLWTNKQMSRLIESILLKLPLPIFYFDVSDPEKWIIVDGLQRLSTINKFFVEKKLVLNNLEFLTDLNGKKYDDLERHFLRIIDDTEFITYQIEAQTPKKVRYSLFNRINTGGLTLNAQEIRQALNQEGNGVSFLKEVCEDDNFKSIVNVSAKRMLDRELVLRFIAFKLTNYKEFSFNNMGEFLDEAMEKLDAIKDDNELVELKKELIDTLKFSETILGKNHRFSRSIANEKKTNTLNRSLFDVLTVCFSEIDNKEFFINNKGTFIDKFLNLLKDENSNFSKAITEGTSTKSMIESRFEIMENLIKEVLNEDR